MSTVGRLFSLLGLEAAWPSAQPEDNKGAAAPLLLASSLCSLIPLSLFFYHLSFCTGPTSLCWVMAGEQQLPVQALSLSGSRAVAICAHHGAGSKSGMSLGGDLQQSVQMWLSPDLGTWDMKAWLGSSSEDLWSHR